MIGRRNRAESNAAWAHALAGRPWGIRLEAYMARAASPEALGRWVSSIWRATDGAFELRDHWEDAVAVVLLWQGGKATQLDAIKTANAYARAAQRWAERRPAA